MSDPVDDLTEKEKEALWLLLAGHDAKSSAMQLDLSVHTINDRLRAARRKLGVSSSREAARLLAGRETEIPEKLDLRPITPQNDVHKGLGIADPGSSFQDDPVETDADEKGSHRRRLRNGVIIMSTLIIAAAVGVAYASGGGSASEASSSFAQSTASNAKAPSQSEALEWLAVLDAGEVEASRDEAGSALRASYSESIWELGVMLRQNNYGTLLSRELTEVRTVDGYVNVGKGDFRVLVFTSDFLRARGVTEEVVMQREEGEWRVVDYDMAKADEK